jgi:hypothetical protein
MRAATQFGSYRVESEGVLRGHEKPDYTTRPDSLSAKQYLSKLFRGGVEKYASRNTQTERQTWVYSRLKQKPPPYTWGECACTGGNDCPWTVSLSCLRCCQTAKKRESMTIQSVFHSTPMDRKPQPPSWKFLGFDWISILYGVRFFLSWGWSE